jgi:recombination protein RecA
LARRKASEENEEVQMNVEEALDSLTQDLAKKYGKGTVIKGNDIIRVPRWELSSPHLGYVLGDGGVPKGRVMEIFGPESGGKTTMATFIAAEIQKQGGVVAVLDAENAFDMDYAETLGLKRDEVLFSQPSSGEETLGIAEDMVKSKLVDFIVIDSVSALTPQAEIEGEMGDQQMGLQARMMGKGLRKITSNLSGKTTICFINQIREKIGCIDPETNITWV